MIEDWLWPLVHYSLANRQPYGYVPITFRGWEALYGSGSLLRTMFYMVVTSPFFVVPFLPFLSAAILVLVICRMRRGSSPDATNSYYVLVCATGIGLVLGVLATGRPDVDHLIYVSPPLILLLGMVLSGQLVKSRLLTEVLPLLFTFFVVTFTAFGMTFLLSGPLSARQSLETRRGHIKLPCCDTMIPFLERYVAPEGKVLVYPYQPLYYFLSGTSSSTSFDYLQLGMHSPEQMERALVELAATPAQVVIWLPTFNTESIPGYWPSTPPTALARDPIRDFILAHYRLCATDSSEGFRVLILMPKGSTCSPQLNGRGKDG